MAVVERVGEFRGQASFKNWVFTIARRRIADHWRRAYRLPEVAADLALVLLASPAPATGDPPDDPPGDGPRPDLDAVLSQLAERDRRVLVCRFREGKSIAETAQELGVSEGNCKVIQHRALARAAQIAQRL